jgi:hypothetical protein
MRCTHKLLLAAAVALLPISMVSAQTSSTATGTQSTASGTAMTSGQQTNSALASRLYGGLNATAAGTPLPLASGLGVVGGTSTAGTATNGVSGSTVPTNGTNPTVNTAPGTLPSQAGAMQPGTSYPNGISAAQPGTIAQGMGPASITAAQQSNNAQLSRTRLNNNGAATGTGTAAVGGTFNMGTGVPGTGMAIPGTIIQGSGNLSPQQAQLQANPALAGRLYGGLGTGQTTLQGAAIPGTTNTVGTTGVQGMGQPAQGTPTGLRTGLNTGLTTSTPPSGLQTVTPGGQPTTGTAAPGSAAGTAAPAAGRRY